MSIRQLLYLFALCDIPFEVSGQGIAEAGNQLEIGRRYLLKMDHVRLGKNRTPSCDARNVLCLEGDFGELFNRETEAGGLLIQKTPCAGGANGIHRKILDTEPFSSRIPLKKNELRVFPAYVDDAAYMRVEMMEGPSDRYDLIDERGAHE